MYLHEIFENSLSIPIKRSVWYAIKPFNHQKILQLTTLHGIPINHTKKGLVENPQTVYKKTPCYNFLQTISKTVTFYSLQ